MALTYTPLTPALEPLFEEGAHVYRYKGWKPPGVSSLLEAVGIKDPFDRTFWRASLLKKGMTEEEAEAFMDEQSERGIERGKNIHSWIEGHCTGEHVPLEELCPEWMALDDFAGYKDGFLQFVEEFEVSKVYLIERPLVNTVGLYCGTVDCMAETKFGTAVIDWKTSTAVKKFKRKPWMKYQLAAYSGAINRSFEIEPVKHGINVCLAPDGLRIFHYEEAEMLETWTNLKGLLRDYWFERCQLAQLDDDPGMACEALEAIEEAWGPFEPCQPS
tara:strand:- start:1109 stop:1927 length:819 start_codon:yes stop_codon:yes gene_type:complete